VDNSLGVMKGRKGDNVFTLKIQTRAGQTKDFKKDDRRAIGVRKKKMKKLYDLRGPHRGEEKTGRLYRGVMGEKNESKKEMTPHRSGEINV